MRPLQHQQIAGLRDVLRRRAPVHPAAMRLARHARQLPHQRHQRVAGAREAFVEPCPIEQLEPGRLADGGSGARRNDAEFFLRLGQRHLDIEPRLPAALLFVEGAQPRIGDARGGGEGVGHGGGLRLSVRGLSVRCGRQVRPHGPERDRATAILAHGLSASRGIESALVTTTAKDPG